MTITYTLVPNKTRNIYLAFAMNSAVNGFLGSNAFIGTSGAFDVSEVVSTRVGDACNKPCHFVSLGSVVYDGRSCLSRCSS